jgi:hypothetical protein
MMAFECSECSTIRESYLKTSAIKGRKISFDKLKEEVENCVDCQEAKKLAEQLPPEIKEMGMSLYCAKHSSVIMDVWNSFDF